MAFGTDRSALTIPSLDSVWPLRPPVAVAVAVNSGLILSIVVSPEWPRRDGAPRPSTRQELVSVLFGAYSAASPPRRWRPPPADINAKEPLINHLERGTLCP